MNCPQHAGDLLTIPRHLVGVTSKHGYNTLPIFPFASQLKNFLPNTQTKPIVFPSCVPSFSPPSACRLPLWHSLCRLSRATMVPSRTLRYDKMSLHPSLHLLRSPPAPFTRFRLPCPTGPRGCGWVPQASSALSWHRCFPPRSLLLLFLASVGSEDIVSTAVVVLIRVSLPLRCDALLS